MYVMTDESINKEQGDLSKRKLTPNEIQQLNDELARFSCYKIRWLAYETYLLPAISAVFLCYFFNWQPLFLLFGFLLGFMFFNFMPFVIKGDSKLIKKDIKEGNAIVLTAPLKIFEINASRFHWSKPAYIKRYYVGDIIIDGIYVKSEEVKYPNLREGDLMKIEYTPSARWIFSVEKMQ